MNKQRNYSKTGRITQGAAIAALCGSDHDRSTDRFRSGPVPDFRGTLRASVLLPSAVPGVTIGCFLANLLCGAAPLDVVFGSLATLIGAVGSYYLGKKNKWLVCVPPILANTIIVPWVLRYAYGSTDLIPYAMVTVGIGEILAIGVLGNILLLALERSHRAVFAQ